MSYLRSENRTKICIIQTVIENDNTHQKPPAPNKSDFKVPNKYVRNSENHSTNNTCIYTPNRYQKLSKNYGIENHSNTGDYVKTNEGCRVKPTLVKEIILTQ